MGSNINLHIVDIRYRMYDIGCTIAFWNNMEVSPFAELLSASVVEQDKWSDISDVSHFLRTLTVSNDVANIFREIVRKIALGQIKISHSSQSSMVLRSLLFHGMMDLNSDISISNICFSSLIFLMENC